MPDRATIDGIVSLLRTDFPDTSEEQIRLKVNGLIKIADAAAASGSRADDSALRDRAIELLGAVM